MDSSGIFCFFFDFPHDFPSDHIFLSWQFPFLLPKPGCRVPRSSVPSLCLRTLKAGFGRWCWNYRQRAQPSDGQQSGKKSGSLLTVFFCILQVLKLLLLLLVLLTNYHELQLVHLIKYHQVSSSIIKYHQVSSSIIKYHIFFVFQLNPIRTSPKTSAALRRRRRQSGRGGQRRCGAGRGRGGRCHRMRPGNYYLDYDSTNTYSHNIVI